MTKYDILYVDGDSYTAPGEYVPVNDSYWKLFKDHIGAKEVVNHAQLSKSNESIFRNTLRFHLQNKGKKVFYLIGFTYLTRLSYVDTSKENKFNKHNPIEKNIHDAQYSGMPEVIKFYRKDGEQLNFYVDLILFYNYMKSTGADFILHNCASPITLDIAWSPSTAFCEEILNFDRCVNLTKNTMMSMCEEKNIKPVDFVQYKWNGHQGPEGNRLYYDYIKEQYDRLYVKNV